MQQHIESPAFVVEFRGLKVACDNIEHVVEAVKALAPLEREVAVPRAAEPSAAPEPEFPANPVATAVHELYREAPQWRRPVEIVRALRKRRVPGAKYTTVYAVLRYGAFVKREGKWNMAEERASA